jgi:hypothetical protein
MTATTLLVLTALIAGTPVCLSARVIDMTPQWDEQSPLANPHKGWYHHYFDNGLHKYLLEDDGDLQGFPGMDHLYLRLAWSYLEPREGEYRWEVIDRVIETWTARGLGIAFRISCRETGTKPVEQQFATPRWVVAAGAKGGHYYKGRKLGPEGPWEPQFNDPVYLAKLDNFLQAFAARYDGKPWLRYVDIGSIGDWGEGHTSSGSGTKYGWPERKRHVDLHCKHFKKTQLVVTDDFVYGIPDEEGRERMHRYVMANNITYRDDSILVDWYVKTYYENATVRSPRYFEEVYPRFPTILELQHYHSAKRTGNWLGSPGSTLAQKGDGKTGADIFREAVDILHATYIGFHGHADVWMRENPALTRELLNRCGYWYFLHRAVLADDLRPGTAWVLKLVWENRGAAPAYHPYDLNVRFVGDKTYDITVPARNQGWMPGRGGQVSPEAYTLPLPAAMKSGRYQLKLKLSCPATHRDVLLALRPQLLDYEQYYAIGSVRVGDAPR